ncbi:hypothetical protein ACA910_010328 [Epithemia clementina (nom. ined.)]
MAATAANNEIDPLFQELGLPESATISLPESADDETVLETLDGTSIAISAATCLRGPTGRALIVGRQAATSDLRIQHKSMSRQHAVLYYAKNLNQSGNGSKCSSDSFLLYVKDLGGKHGTIVNGQRLSAHEPLRLQEGDRIQFGNVRENLFVVRFRQRSNATAVQFPTKATNGTALRSSTVSTEASSQAKMGNVEGTGGIGLPETGHPKSLLQEQPNSQLILETVSQSLTGRAKREAELAAMMESLDQTPAYQRYTPAPEENRSAKVEDGEHVLDSTPRPDNHTMIVAKKHQIPLAQIFQIPPSCSSSSLPSSTSATAVRTATTTCIVLDPSGSRFALGSRDSYVRLYDFSGMDHRHAEPFQATMAQEGYGVVSCVYSNTGDRLLVGTASAQPVVLDRDGRQPPIVHFVRGDVYVSDQSKTMGHVAAVTAVDWHPLERDIVLTASLDGSARLWNLATGKLQFEKLTCHKVFSAKSQRGARTAVTSICFHPGGRYFALGTACGSLQIWSTNSRSNRPERVVQTSHSASITWLQYSFDGTKLASRCCASIDNPNISGDNMVLVWTTSQSPSSRLLLSADPVSICLGLPTVHEHANFCFSPNGQYGCGAATALVSTQRAQDESSNNNGPIGNTTKQQQRGSLNFYALVDNKETKKDDLTSRRLEPIIALETAVGDAGPVLVQWHKGLNQILVACDDGSVTVYLDQTMGSKNGALLALRKVGRNSSLKGEDALSALLRSRATQGLAALTGEIVAPLATNPMTRRKRRNMEETVPPEKLREPERPVSGKHKAGFGGGGGVPATLQQFVADQAAAQQQKKQRGTATTAAALTEGGIIAGKDPREALLQYSRPEDTAKK